VLAQVWALARASDDQDPAHIARQWQQRRADARTHAERSYRLLAPLLAAKGRFLDIACGLGETVRCFADRGWEAEGIDADPNMIPFHRELAIRSCVGQIEDLEIGNAYEVIHIAHAIYFITDPMQFLRRLRTYLTENGLLCVVLSDFLSSFGYNLPSYAHTFYPSATSMQFALALAGFETVLVQKVVGSIYIVARPGRPDPPRISTVALLLRYRTQKLRSAIIGGCARALGPIARRLLR
jgi:SAM-dependent methyltransferase